MNNLLCLEEAYLKIRAIAGYIGYCKIRPRSTENHNVNGLNWQTDYRKFSDNSVAKFVSFPWLKYFLLIDSNFLEYRNSVNLVLLSTKHLTYFWACNRCLKYLTYIIFTHLIIQQIFGEQSSCARQYPRCWIVWKS